MSDRIKFNLLENAFDYLLSAAECVKKGTPRDNKYSLLHLVAGIELLFKERLAQEHWSLIFNDIDNANRVALETGDFKGIDLDKTIKRLEGIVGVKLSKLAIDNIRKIRDLRNRIQHFAVNVELEQAQSMMAIGFNILLEFYHENIKDQSIGESIIGDIYLDLRHFQSFVDERLKAIKPQIEIEKYLFDCNRCLNRTIALQNGKPYCLFCRYELDSESLAMDISEDGILQNCPHCEQMTCTWVLYNNDYGEYVCTSCGERGDYSICSRCQNLKLEEEDPCPDCWEQIMSKA